MKTASILFCLPMLMVPLAGAHARPEHPVGSAVQVVNLVTAEFNRDTRTLQRGDRVHQDETIEVGLDGSSELKLDDDTKLALGPGSHLTLDKFVYDAEKAKGSIVLDLVKGTFRFMTGVAEKPTYIIKTPAAAITVRGTIFDVYVENNGLSWLLLHEGAVQVCNQRGDCKDLTEPGKLIRIGDDGAVGPPVRWASLPGSDKVPFDDAFPFVTKAPSIDPNPVLTRDVIVLGTLPTGKPPKKTETYPEDKRGRDVTESPPPKETKKRKPRETYDETPKYEKKKPKKQAKKQNSDDDNIVSGMDIVIGGGLAIGRMKGKHKGGGDYGGGMGGMGRGMPGRGMGGGGMGGGGYGGKPH